MYRPVATKALLNLIICTVLFPFNPGAELGLAGPAQAEEPPTQPRSGWRKEKGIALETVLQV